MTGRHWLEAIDHASNNPAIREELREMVKRETTAAYNAGVTDTTQENPMTDQPRNTSHDLAGGDVDRPMTLADRAAAASTAAEPTTEEHLEAGAYARAVLAEQLEAAREEHARSIDLLQDVQEQADAEALAVQRLTTALADLDDAARRRGHLEHIITGSVDAAAVSRALRDREARQ